MTTRSSRCAVVIAAALASARCTGVTEPELLTIESWLTCHECLDGERQGVRDIGSPAVPALASALRGPPDSVRAVLRRQVESDYRYVAGAVADSATFVNGQLAEKIATIQMRAAISLGDLDAERVLLEALDSAVARQYAPEVIRAINRAVYQSTGVLRFGQVDASTASTCGLTTSGDIYCWGDNADGQLGDGTTIGRAAAAPVQPPVRFQSMNQSVGAHRCGISQAGIVYCWGNNDSGQVGRPAPSIQPFAYSPTLAAGPGPRPTFASVRTGGFHSCADSAGRLTCWGANSAGQLGIGNADSTTVRVAVVFDSAFVAFALGGLHTCALTASGVAFCWGNNAYGQLGDGSTTGRTTPTPVAGGHVYRSLTAGLATTCAATMADTAYCWGLNASGQLGDGSTTAATVPRAVSGGLSFRQLAAGFNHTCGVTTDGTAYCWGGNDYGQFGNGTTTSDSVPVRVTMRIRLLTPRFFALSVGGAHSCGISTDSLLYCWGDNDRGQVGVAPVVDVVAYPVRVPAVIVPPP